MALVLGTNAGFVESAPSEDPDENTYTSDNAIHITLDTSPAGSTTITEIGWYCGNATEEANFEVGLYDDEGTDGNAKNLLEVERTNAKGTTGGWKVVTGLNWSIDASTRYGIAVQLDNTASTTSIDMNESGGNDWDFGAGATIPDPWTYFSSAPYFPDGMAAIYAVWEGEAVPPPHTSINIGDTWKAISGANVMKINIGDNWKNASAANINIGDSWKAITLS